MKQEQIQNVHSELSETLNSLYLKRKRTLLFQKLVWGLAGVFFILMLINLTVGFFPDSNNGFVSFFRRFQSTVEHPYANIYPLAVVVVLVFFSVTVFSGLFRKFKTLEQEAISKMVWGLFPQTEFAQNTIVPLEEIRKSRIFASINMDTPMYNYGQMRCKKGETVVNIFDLGIIDNTVQNKFMTVIKSIPLVNVFPILYQYAGKNMATDQLADNVHYSFRGMFCWMNIEKRLKGHTVVLTNNYAKKIDRIANLKFNEEQQVVLEDPRFTSQFLVYSTDQIEARYVLSTSMMERIVALKEKFDQPILLSFQNRRLYVAVENRNGLFSFPSGKIDSFRIVEELAYDIDCALTVAESLKVSDE